MIACRSGYGDDIFLNGAVNVNPADYFLYRYHLFGCCYRFQVLYRVDKLLPVQDIYLVRRRWVAEVDGHQKPVELRFRQRKGAFILNRVFSCENMEWCRYLLGGSFYT